MEGQPSLRRHETLYLPDGNIVLASTISKTREHTAQVQRDEHVLFRVHISILTMHSAVFKDMFSSPGKAVNDSYEGAPLVMMQDTVAELEAFLKALYFGLCVIMRFYCFGESL